MNFRQNAKRIFTTALVVWMSGIVLFLCCEMPSSAAAMEMESCPLAKKGNCAKTVAEDSTDDSKTSFKGESRRIDCCNFPAQIFDKARKIEAAPQATVISKSVEMPAPKFFIVEKNFNFSTVPRSFVRNRGSTYLNNCVFRI